MPRPLPPPAQAARDAWLKCFKDVLKEDEEKKEDTRLRRRAKSKNLNTVGDYMLGGARRAAVLLPRDPCTAAMRPFATAPQPLVVCSFAICLLAATGLFARARARVQDPSPHPAVSSLRAIRPDCVADLVGEGGYAKVKSGFHVKTGARIAAKILTGPLSAEVKREIMTMSALKVRA